MHRFRLLLLSFFSLAAPAVILAQVQAGSANFASTTEYQINGQADSIFVFYEHNTDRYIEGISPDGDVVLFEWYRFNPSTNTYALESSETDSISQVPLTDDNAFLEPFGYQLIITGDTYIDTSRCWMVLNNLHVEITNADTADVAGKPQKVIREFQKRCNLISDINARVDSAEMYYFNLITGEPVKLNSSFSLNNLNWSSSPEPEEGENEFSPNDRTWLSVVVNDPWWDDSYLLITIEDTLGYEVADSVWHESIIPHSNFSFEHILLDCTLYYPDKSERYYEVYGSSGDPITYDGGKSAPAKFLFTNESENANLYTWFFDDGVNETVSEDSVVHTYNLPGNYYPYMLAENHLITGDVCADTFPSYQERSLEENMLVVDEPPGFGTESELPNVFSPPNPPNNYWRFYHDASMTNFEIAIYNRYGKRVYHFEGNIRDWEGWDGTINNSSRVAVSGVYFYVIKNITPLPFFENPLDDAPNGPVDIHENESPNNNLKRGFIHLYNDE